ncbi:hypothetical protein [Spiroplasma chrysopicola]|uniref:hypothetical protein n=1 Tax=Spiroplasma chrysopicola TaxID=216933 RepID=UPI001F2B2B82|nr:hypothetical protein [Spiroplasma chrysopicola]
MLRGLKCSGLLSQKTLQAEAEKYNCTVFQLILLWVKYFNIQPVVSAHKLSHLQQNILLPKVKLARSTIKLISSLNMYENIYPELFNVI